MRLLIMGPPGSGKGTQSNRLRERMNLVQISTGDIFRANIEQKTELGRQIRDLMARGEYVPDELTNRIVADRLARPDVVEGFLLDGYPRTLDQVLFLDVFLQEQGRSIDAALRLKLAKSELVKRLHGRAKAEGRADDTEEVIQKRLEVYSAQTEPLLEQYRDRNLLVEVDGLGEVGEVTERILAALKRR